MEDFFDFVESQFDPQTTFEFDLGMCLGALRSLIDEPDEWSELEFDWFMNLADELLERFSAKYPDWMEEYSRRKAIEGPGNPS